MGLLWTQSTTSPGPRQLSCDTMMDMAAAVKAKAEAPKGPPYPSAGAMRSALEKTETSEPAIKAKAEEAQYFVKLEEEYATGMGLVMANGQLSLPRHNCEAYLGGHRRKRHRAPGAKGAN